MTTGRTKTRFLLIGIVVAVTAYLFSGSDDIQHNHSDVEVGKAYTYEVTTT